MGAEDSDRENSDEINGLQNYDAFKAHLQRIYIVFTADLFKVAGSLLIYLRITNLIKRVSVFIKCECHVLKHFPFSVGFCYANTRRSSGR